MAKKPDDKKTADQPEIDEVEASRAPLMDHLLELRTRMVRILVVVGVLFLGGWYVTEWVLAFLLQPLSDAAHRAGRPIEETIETVTTAPMEMIFVKLKMSFLLAVAVSFPYIAYQIYAFVAPGLYKNERSAVLPYLFLMPVLFTAGGALVYQFVLPTFMDLSFSQEFTARGRESGLPAEGQGILRADDLVAHLLWLCLPASHRHVAAGARWRREGEHAAQGDASLRSWSSSSLRCS